MISHDFIRLHFFSPRGRADETEVYKKVSLCFFVDFEKNKPKRNCPNRELIQKLINEKVNEYSTHILDLKASKKDFTANNFNDIAH
jgi:hypothetical protein